jgi:predicted CxxxxCH...CXXCH cytochrome family protein
MKKFSDLTLLVLLTMALVVVSCKKDFDPDPEGLGPHTQGWTDPNTGNTFHGDPAMRDDADNCRGCHAANLRGQDDVVSCYECHGVLHMDVTNENTSTHQAFVVDANYKLARCQRCHGSNYTGGTSGMNCTSCHTADSDRDLTGCDVCHSMPPTADGKVPYGMSPEAAGAHYTHAVRAGKHCSECHPSLSASGHPHALPADVSFDRSVLATGMGANPTFTHIGNSTSGNGSCSNVYCHSNGRADDLQFATIMPEWTAPGPLSCRSCHAFPPPAPHPTGTTCSTCHTNVDPTSDFTRPFYGTVRFLVDSLHVDGIVEH